jgi:transmembrane sensor
VAIATVAIALAAILLLAVLSPHLLSFGESREERFVGRTAPPLRDAFLLSAPTGEARAFKLADGSTVTVEGGGSVEIRFGAAERRLDLTRGRARFKVFHEQRPFVVHAAGQSSRSRWVVTDA